LLAALAAVFGVAEAEAQVDLERAQAFLFLEHTQLL
jgi:hypothetical protein